MPQINQRIGPSSAAAGEKPDIVGARGPLTAQQSKALLGRISTEPGDAGLLQRHMAIEEAVAENPLITGNRTKLLRDGPAAFRAVFSAIQGATKFVNLEYYIFEDVESDGMHLGDLLVAKREAGVAVNVIYDSYGSSATPDVNLSATYESNPFGSRAPGGKPDEHWRDTDLEIDGPVVAQLERLFLDTWSKQKGAPISEADMFPTVPAKGTAVVRIVGSTPDKSVPRYYVTLLSAVRNAEKSVFITTAYFVPTEQELEDLTGAARRGIDVRLLLPDTSDSDLSISVAHSHYTELLEAGVKIFETHDLVLHSKTVVVDGVWSIIGSSNFDHRSVIFNDEVDAVVLGSETASEMEAMFNDDQRGAKPVDLAAWKNRPLFQRLDEKFATVWEKML